MQEESKILAPVVWGKTLDLSLSFNNKGDQHATSAWELSYHVFGSRRRRDPVRHHSSCMAEDDTERPGVLVWHLCRHQWNHCGGGCTAGQRTTGVGIAPLRGYPGYPGGGGCPGMAEHHRARVPLPAGGLGDHYRHYGGRRTARVPDERWAHWSDGAGRGDIGRLRHPDRRPTFVWAA